MLVNLVSCHSDQVVSNHLIQKRKYNKGWRFTKCSNNSGKLYPVLKDNDSEQIVSDNHPVNRSRKLETHEFENQQFKTTVHKGAIYTKSESIENSGNDLLSEDDHDVVIYQANVQESKVENIEEDDDPRTTDPDLNKAALWSFITMIVAYVFIGIGIAVGIQTDAFIAPLLFGIILFLLSLILMILAITKYKEKKKRFILAVIVAYTNLAVIAGLVVLFIIGLINAASYITG